MRERRPSAPVAAVTTSGLVDFFERTSYERAVQGGDQMTVNAAFRQAVDARDLAAILAKFREDAVLHSPVSFHPFEGREAISHLFRILLEIFDEFRYTDELISADGRTVGLVFRARVGDRNAEGLDLLRFDEEGKVRELTVMVRPRSALEALFAAVASRLAASANP